MLVLGRKIRERVFVGDDIEVVAVEVRGNQVKLGFNAPDYLPIRRAELRQMESDFRPWENAESASHLRLHCRREHRYSAK